MIHILSNVHTCTKTNKQKTPTTKSVVTYCLYARNVRAPLVRCAVQPTVQCALSIKELGAGERCSKKGLTLQGQKKEKGRTKRQDVLVM